MSGFLDQMRAYRAAAGVPPTDYAVLLAHYPLFKVMWLAEYGGPACRPAAAWARRLLRPYRLWHRVTDRAGRPVRTFVPFAADDYASFAEVMIGGTYDLPATGVRRVVDLGANTGMASAWFLLRWPEITTLVAVEANDRLAAALGRTLGRVGGRRVVVEHRCVADTDEPFATLTVDENHRHSRVGGGGGGRSVRVRTTRLAGVLDRAGLDEVDLLKVDIEGAEYGLLGEPAALRRCRQVFAEVHGTPAERERFVAGLRDLGYDVARGPGGPTGGCTEVVRAVRSGHAAVDAGPAAGRGGDS